MNHGRSSGPSSEFVRFVVTGSIAAGVNVAVRVPFGWIMPYSISIVFAYLVGMTTAFLLARTLVFRPTSRSVAGEYMRFALVNAVALVQVLLVSLCLERLIFPWLGLTWHMQTVAHAIGVASPVVSSYYGHKFFSFRGITRDRGADFS
jgi:putative flippase GtrA